MDKMSEFWSVNEGVFYCLFDRKRTTAFKRAIKASVRPGDVVVELGAGTGVLSLFAADAGAAKVYAVELDESNLRNLRATVDANGYADRVIVMPADATTVELPEPVDVIICEMIATALLEELQIPAMNNALGYAKPGARVVLQRYDIHGDLVDHKNDYYGKRFDVIRYEFPDKPSLKSQPVTDRHTLAEVDFRQPIHDSLIAASFVLPVVRDGVVNGLRLSTNTIFADGSEFDFSISYSFPVILPVAETEVERGDLFAVDISYSMCEGPERLDYTVERVG